MNSYRIDLLKLFHDKVVSLNFFFFFLFYGDQLESKFYIAYTYLYIFLLKIQLSKIPNRKFVIQKAKYC